MENHSGPVEIESRVEADIGNFVLRTRGLKQYKPFEMELRISQNLTGAPYRTVYLAPAGETVDLSYGDYIWVTPPAENRRMP